MRNVLANQAPVANFRHPTIVERSKWNTSGGATPGFFGLRVPSRCGLPQGWGNVPEAVLPGLAVSV
jgi:hypothetical protein